MFLEKVESGEEYAKENSIGYDKGEGRWVGLWDSPEDFDTFAADKAHPKPMFILTPSLNGFV